MGLQANLNWAQKAVAEVDKALPLGAANKMSPQQMFLNISAFNYSMYDNIARITGGQLDPVFFNTAKHFQGELIRLRKCQSDLVAATGMPEDAKDRATWVAEAAKEARTRTCGNSGQQNAVAFEWLKKEFIEKRIKIPLDFVGVERRFMPAFDHDFVVIGRRKGSDIKKISTWGNDAVVCDPWWPISTDRAYAATALKQKMRTDKVFDIDKKVFLQRMDVEPMLDVFHRWEG
jgi:hypothetical protein